MECRNYKNGKKTYSNHLLSTRGTFQKHNKVEKKEKIGREESLCVLIKIKCCEILQD